MNQLDWFFGLKGYERNLIFCEKDESSISASITTEENYQRITLKIYPCFFEETLEAQREIILHEYSHTILQTTKVLAYNLLEGNLETKKTIDYENERATSKIQHLLNSLLEGNSQYVVKAYKNVLSKKKKK